MQAEPRPRVLAQAVLDAMPSAAAQLSERGEILGVNAAWRTLAELSGLLPSTNVTTGTNYLEACERAATSGIEWAKDAAATVRRVLEGEVERASHEYELVTSTATRWLELVVTRLDGDGFRGALITQVDITPRKAAARALLRSETRYRAIVESAPVGIYQTALDGRILAANQRLADIVAAESADDLIGTSIRRFYAHPDEREALVAQHQREAAGTPIELEWKRLDDVPIWVELAAQAVTDAAGRTVYWEGFVYDISERKRLEGQLSQAQKMESVGRLAGGIAHDFNNLLTVMIGYAELLHTSDEMPAPFRAAVSEILAAARRAAELTGRMLAFARKQRVRPRAVDVNDVVRGVEGLLRRIIGEDVSLEVRLVPELPPVLIDPAQLEQVLMNLAVNARDAMPHGGVLTILSDAVEISDEEARRRPGLKPGPYVRLAVTDTGVGMDAETLAHVFEPFFTTKEPGKGTGLGLAMCYGIIKQAHGFIGCDSSRGVGTTCTVMLPPASEKPASPQTSAADSPDGTRSGATRATILVVEDEPVLRQFVADILTASGHMVHATGSPPDGLEIAAAQSRIDLLVTDIVMPQIDGVTLAERVRVKHPNMRVLLMSGQQDRRLAEGATASMLLPKPFTATQLRARVAEALQGAHD